MIWEVARHWAIHDAEFPAWEFWTLYGPLEFLRDWYRPDLMAVIAVGDFDARRVEARIRERFGDLEGPEAPRERVTPELPEHDEHVRSG